MNRLSEVNNHYSISELNLFGSSQPSDGTYTVSPTTNGDTGLTLEIIVNNNSIASIKPTNFEGSGYSIGDVLTINDLPDSDTLTINLITDNVHPRRYVGKLLKEGGYTAREILSGGFPITDLKSGGFTVAELKAEDPSFTPLEIKNAGYTGRELLAGGYLNTDLVIGEYDVDTLLENENPVFSMSDLKEGQYTPGEFYKKRIDLIDQPVRL